jgi:hypothetical protein
MLQIIGQNLEVMFTDLQETLELELLRQAICLHFKERRIPDSMGLISKNLLGKVVRLS